MVVLRVTIVHLGTVEKEKELKEIRVVAVGKEEWWQS